MTDSLPPAPPASAPSYWPPDPDPARNGPPWEHTGPWLTRFVRTVQPALLEPTAFFRTMRRTGGLGAPVLFSVLGTLLGGAVAVAYQLMFAMLGSGFGASSALREQAMVSLFTSSCFIVLVPVAALVGMFIAAAIYHVMLLLLGDARRPFETTMRVVGYGHGSTALLNVIPVCGGVIGAVWAIVITIIGLSQSHEISTGKAATAVLLPAVLCCLVSLAVFAGTMLLFFNHTLRPFQ
jgi:hypothetical protein